MGTSRKKNLMAGKTKSKTVEITTGIGTLSFPHLSKSQAENNKNDKGEPRYDIQIIIPKSQREDLKAIFKAIKEVGMDKWGDKWTQVRNPLRDGDAEKDELTEDGTTKGEKYPERLGCYFLNARSSRPVGVVDRSRNIIDDPENEVYGGCKGKINVGFYSYSNSGNHGIGAGLNGVQKVADGEAFGATRTPVESMFDALDDEDTDDLGADLDSDDVDEAPAPAKKAAKKAPAKRAAKKAAAPVEDIDDDGDSDDQDDLFDDLDD